MSNKLKMSKARNSNWNLIHFNIKNKNLEFQFKEVH